MKKLLSVLMVALIAIAAFTGCGKKDSGKSINVAKLAQDLQGTITSEIKEVNDSVFTSTFFIDLEKVDEYVAMLNSGAYAPEVVVLKCKDSKYPSEAEGLFKQRQETQSGLFASYNAPEAEKYDNAILKTSGNYVVFCVTDDTDAAEKIIKEAGF